MSTTGFVMGLTIGLIVLVVVLLVYSLIATILDGIRNGEWFSFIFIIVFFGVPMLGATIGALVA